MLLDKSTKSIQLILGEVKNTNELDVVVQYEDLIQERLSPVEFVTISNGTTLVTIVAAPVDNTARIVREITICNLDVIDHIVKIRRAISTTYTYLVIYTICPNETLKYTITNGWDVLPINASVLSGYATTAYADALIQKPLFLALAAANQNVASVTPTKVTLGNEIYDTNNYFAASRFTPLVAGYYSITIGFIGDDTVSASSIIPSLYKNGASILDPAQFQTGGGFLCTATFIVQFNGSTDYVELWGQVTGTAPYFRYINDKRCCFMQGNFVRSL